MNKEINKRIIVSAIVGVIIIGGGAFYTGTKYAGAKSGSAQGVNFAGQMRGGTGMRGGQGFGGTTIGKIVAKDDTSITVKLRDGGSKIVFFTDKTAVTKNISGSVSDLTLNEQVVVNGSANSDGSINAQTIQLGSGIPGFRQAQNLPTSN